ncbi:MAG TPA: YlxR family protein [Candidatus Copromorpha excrementigallinarum]|uniref:YlxR family protein n=1 Tax=Candidatus Allocopromorpha excrementigallinarum TaxID=2840742 RepID=A0A9D1HYT9_9FIRM|nr:YlxR family protein [Candidatus Copromorpha excrementigallinarum]
MKNKKVPMRRCVGCMESKEKSRMIRVACYEGKVSVDPTGKAKGRGVYLCRDRECMEKAKKKRALQRNFEAEITQEEINEIFQELSKYEEKGD